MDSAIGFINAIKSRQNTMLNTMKAIVHFQKEFFTEGDELSIKPLTMKKVAEMAKVDISTVSRVCNRKYVETPYGIFPLKHFFGDSFQTGEGEDVATRIIRAYLKEVISKEDKHNPLTDEQLAEKGLQALKDWMLEITPRFRRASTRAASMKSTVQTRRRRVVFCSLRSFRK